MKKFLQGFINGWNLIKESFVIFAHHPLLIVPLFLTYMVYAPIILWINFGIDIDKLTLWQDISYTLIILFIFAFILTFSCSLLLELIQQHESGQKMNFFKAWKDTLIHNLFHMLPLILLWTIVWFILVLLQSIFSKSKSKDENKQLSAENAARTLGGDGPWTFSEAFFQALQKVFRMAVFLVLPAIAWENMTFTNAWKRGISILTSHKTEFVSGFVLTEAVATVIFLPIAILFSIADGKHISIPQFVWIISLLYIAIAWSYTIYTEQMYTALLYLWHLRWEKEIAYAKQMEMPLHDISKTEKPSLLDNILEFSPK